MEWLNFLLGGGGRGWVEAALIIGLFWAALAHPDRIRSLWEFRLAVMCLGLATVAPVLIQIFLIGQRTPGARPPQPSPSGLEWAMYASAIPPFLTMLAILLGLDSVLSKKARRPVSVGDQPGTGKERS